MIIYLTLFILIIAADLLIKLWAKKFLLLVGSTSVIPKVLNWTYVENRGVAFGFMDGKKYLITILGIILVITCAYIVYKQIYKGKVENFCICSIAAGGLANIIDRMINGYVIDYIDISPLFNYPVFNFADCCIVIGTIVLFIKVIFTKDEKNNNSI